MAKKTLDSFLKKHKAKIDKGREERRKTRIENHQKRQEFDAKIAYLEGEVIRPSMKKYLEKMESYGHQTEVLNESLAELYPYRNVSFLINPYGLPDFLKLTFYGNAEDMKVYVRSQLEKEGTGKQEEQSFEVDQITPLKIEELLIEKLSEAMPE